MSNTERPGPRDYNRAARNTSASQNLDAWPRPLRWAYWVLVVSAVLMLVSGMVGIFGSGGPQVEPQNVQVAEYLHENRLFVAVTNAVGAVVLALFAAQLASGSKWARRIITIVIAIALFNNIAALALGIGGLSLLIIPISLIIALALLFQPQSNRFIKDRSLRG